MSTHPEQVVDVEVEVEDAQTKDLNSIDATPAGIMESIDIAAYAQFLYNANIGGEERIGFNAEGIKTIALQYGISTGPVEVMFLNEDKTEAVFSCTATNIHTGQTASVNVSQSKISYGKESKFWIETGTSRAIRNSQKALLPVHLLKTALQKAIAKGEAEKSKIAEAQKKCTEAFKKYTGELSKEQCLAVAENAFGMSYIQWDSELWDLFATALQSEDFEAALPDGNGNTEN